MRVEATAMVNTDPAPVPDCPACDGSGDCPECLGGHFDDCEVCEGEGTCPECDGTGEQQAETEGLGRQLETR